VHRRRLVAAPRAVNRRTDKPLASFHQRR
jgi:hypothetical protein